MRKTILAAVLTLLSLVLLIGHLWADENVPGGVDVIPWPANATLQGGDTQFSADTRIVTSDETLRPLGQILADDMQSVSGLHPSVVSDEPRDGDITLKIDPQLKNEDYVLTVGNRTTIQGADYNAVEMGTVTLLQLLKTDGGKVVAPKGVIHDGPKFKYTGFMLDIARKPWSIEGLKKYVIFCRFNKIRFFQLHMTDDNAWTFPSTAFPKLGSANYAWAGGEKPTVYSVQELKDLVAFADARGVTIVPELELLGHSDAMRIPMPEMFDSPDKPGGHAHLAVLNIANDAMYPALDTLIGEACDIFKSSPYIHIGCDEARLGPLEAEPKTTEYLKAHNMPNVQYLVTQHIARLNAFINKRGKRTIVWEPAIGYGDLPKNIIAMPWVGNNKAADGYLQQGIEFISAPWGIEKPYQDVYNVNGSNVPRGNPLLIGSTAVNWQNEEGEPGGASIFQEPVYNPDANRGQADFFRRAAIVNPVADKMIYGFTFQTAGQLPMTVFNNANAIFTRDITLTLDCAKAGQVRYMLDGTPVTADSQIYSKPILLNDSTLVRAKWFSTDGSASGYAFSRQYKKQPTIQNEALGAKVTLDPPNPGYFNGGPKSLTDGFLAANESCGDPCVVGWQASPTITLELDKPREIRTVYIRFIVGQGGLHLPKSVEFSTSNDGVKFNSVGKIDGDEGMKTRGWYGVSLQTPLAAKFVRVHAEQGGDWTFTDEVAVNALPPGPNLSNEAMGKPVTVTDQPNNGDLKSPPLSCLTDGYISNTPDWNNPEWLGFRKELNATVDLGKPTDLNTVGAHFMQHVWAGVRIPSALDILVSDDGVTFRNVATINHKPNNNAAEVITLSTTLDHVRARYVRFHALPVSRASIFVDEVFVNPMPRE